MTRPEPITIFLVCPITSLRIGVSTMLSGLPAVNLVGEGASLEAGSALSHQPDLLVIASPASAPQNWLARVAEVYPSVPVLWIVNPDELSLDSRLLNQKAAGFLPLEFSGDELESAVNALFSGLTVISPVFSTASGFQAANPAGVFGETDFAVSVDPLTPREREILQTLATGLPNKEIALKFNISDHTVKYHLSSIFSKLGVTNRTEAVRAGLQAGLITL